MQPFVRCLVVVALCAMLGACKARRGTKNEPGATVVDAGPAPCAELSRRLCAHFGATSEVCAFVEQQARRFSDVNCRTRLAQFARNVAQLERYQKARRAIAAPVQRSAARETPASGPLEAPVVLVVFCDFDLADCGRLSPLHTIVKNLHADQVRIVYRQFPLSKHPGAHLAAEASLAAQAQGKFWEYHDVLYSNPQDHGREALERYAKGIGMTMTDLRDALDAHRYAADVDADKELGRDLFVSELPAVFANGRAVPAPYGVVELSKVIDDAMAARAKP